MCDSVNFPSKIRFYLWYMVTIIVNIIDNRIKSSEFVTYVFPISHALQRRYIYSNFHVLFAIVALQSVYLQFMKLNLNVKNMLALAYSLGVELFWLLQCTTPITYYTTYGSWYMRAEINSEMQVDDMVQEIKSKTRLDFDWKIQTWCFTADTWSKIMPSFWGPLH